MWCDGAGDCCVEMVVWAVLLGCCVSYAGDGLYVVYCGECGVVCGIDVWPSITGVLYWVCDCAVVWDDCVVGVWCWMCGVLELAGWEGAGVGAGWVLSVGRSV